MGHSGPWPALTATPGRGREARPRGRMSMRRRTRRLCMVGTQPGGVRAVAATAAAVAANAAAAVALPRLKWAK